MQCADNGYFNRVKPLCDSYTKYLPMKKVNRWVRGNLVPRPPSNIASVWHAPSYTDMFVCCFVSAESTIL